MSDETLMRDFKRKRIEIMRSKQFVELGPIMMMGRRTFTRDVPTACTDGRDEYYNPDFIFQWGDKGAGFINLHENFHKAARHLEVYKTLHAIDPDITNRACDYWINYTITKADPQELIVAMPRDAEGKPIGCLDARFADMSVKRIFDILMDEKRQGGDGEGDGSGGGLDEHDWEGATKMSAEEKGQLKDDIDTAIRQGIMAAKKAGKGSGSNSLNLDELLNPVVDWVEQLKHFIRATCTKSTVATYRRLDRRFLRMGLAMPTLRGEAIKELVVGPDVSGSMFFDNSFMVCMSEIEGLARQLDVEKIHLIYWDGEVCQHEEYTTSTFKNWRTLTRPTGGGGTDPTCLSTYLKEKKIKPDAAIILTDGDVVGWGEWECPTLWAIHNMRETITAPVGKTIQLERRV